MATAREKIEMMRKLLEGTHVADAQPRNLGNLPPDGENDHAGEGKPVEETNMTFPGSKDDVSGSGHGAEYPGWTHSKGASITPYNGPSAAELALEGSDTDWAERIGRWINAAGQTTLGPVGSMSKIHPLLGGLGMAALAGGTAYGVGRGVRAFRNYQQHKPLGAPRHDDLSARLALASALAGGVGMTYLGYQARDGSK